MEFRIALAEDNAVNRNTFMQKLSLSGKLRLIFSANNGRECLEKLKGLFHTEMPQVIFMDLKMPEMDGIETIRIAKSLYPQIHFIVLTIFDDDSKIFDAIKAGASGYLLKDSSPSEIEDAIRKVYAGETVFPSRITKIMIKELNRPIKSSTKRTTLTDREIEILKIVALGLSNQEIANRLFLSVWTVRTYVTGILEKLEVDNRTQATLYALREGLANLED